jgi:hypothetical protein
LLEFLETWNFETIYKLIDQKVREYLWLIEELKSIQLKNKINYQKNKEEKEREKEEKELNTLINF